MSQKIEIHTSLDLPASLARNELFRVMNAIHDHEPPYQDAALHVGLHDLRLPVPGEVGVPIETQVQGRPFQYECTLKIAATGGAELFPKFSGELSVSALGSGACELWLQGQYDVPMGGVGAAIDATLFNGAAKRSLTEFLEFLAGTLSQNVKQQQAAVVSGRTGRPVA